MSFFRFFFVPLAGPVYLPDKILVPPRTALAPHPPHGPQHKAFCPLQPAQSRRPGLFPFPARLSAQILCLASVHVRLPVALFIYPGRFPRCRPGSRSADFRIGVRVR